jgi:uncharacterized protein (DUF362 family)
MSRVVVVKYSGKPKDDFLDRDQYRCLLEQGLGLMSNNGSYAPYLKNRFPGGTVGMKTNCLAAWNPTFLPLVDALSELLTDKAGIVENDIVVWDRTNRELERAGYKLNASSFGRRCLGTDANGVGYENGQFFSAGKVNSLVTRILTEMVDHSINLGVLKHHSIAGMSAGMKNMYGAVSNPNKYHANNCSPYAADVNNLDPIRKKHRLTIVDAVRVQYDRGPGFDSASMDYYHGLILSEDPVAADVVSLEILKFLRRRNGAPTLAERQQDVRYLLPAQDIGLGTGKIEDIDLQVAVITPDGSVAKGDLLQ